MATQSDMPARKRSPPKKPPVPPPLVDDPSVVPEETRAADLVPARPAVAPEQRKVGLRRVVGHRTSERLLERRGFRPAGNSAAFWRRMEEDDPFLAPAGSALSLLDGPRAQGTAAADRIDRTARPPALEAPLAPFAPKPQPKAVRETSQAAVSASSAPRTQPVARVPAKPAAKPAIVDRRPPRIVDAHKRLDGADAIPRPQLVDTSGRTPAEVRREREAARAPSIPAQRNLDEIMGMISELSASEANFRQQLEEDEAIRAAGGTPEPRPPRPTPRPAPAPRPPPTPDSEAPARVDRSPRAATTPAALDDLMGGGAETRLRIGKRTRPKGTPDEG